MATRNLQVDIDGDPSGFDRACTDAADAARVFDRELARLERAQRDQERAASSASRATHDYGSAMGDAEVASRRAGLAAKEAGDRSKRAQDQAAVAAERAAIAQKNAADAAEALGRGEITAAEAAKAQARALGEVARAEGLAEVASRQLERANIAQALAARAAGKAEDDLAEQERQAARAAVLAAGVQQLAHLRAAGSIREHNLLLRRLRNDYGDLGRGAREMSTLAQRAFGLVESAGTSAATSMASAGPMMVAGVTVALAALPAIAVGVGAAVTLGLGAGLAGMAIMAASKNAEVQKSFTDLKTHVGHELTTMAQPFVPVLEHIATVAGTTFDSLAPALSGAFKVMAPAVSYFADSFGHSMSRLGPTITKIGDEFAPLLMALGDQMPTIMDNIATGIEKTVSAVSGHEGDFAQFAVNLSKIVTSAGEVVSALAPLSSTINDFTPDSWSTFFGDLNPSTALANGLFKSLSGSLGDTKTGFDETSQASWDAQGGIAAASGAAGTLGTKVKTAAQEVTDLNSALNNLLNPSLAVYNDTTKLTSGMIGLRAALKKSHGEMGLQTAASRAARDAFTGQISTVADLGQQTLKLTGNQEKERLAVAKQLPGLYALAGSNKGAKAQVDALARSFGINASDANSARTQIKKLKDEIAALKSKDIHVTTHYTSTTRAEKGMGGANAATGGYAIDGQVRRYAAAGAVTGPGTGTSDSIPAMLSNGEYVVNAAATARNRKTLDAMNWGKASIPQWGKASYDPWHKESYDPFVKSSISAATSFSRAPAEVASMANPSWWHGQASTAFGPGTAHFAWGSARPDVAAAAAAAKAPPPPTFVRASIPAAPLTRASIAPSKLTIELKSNGSAHSDYLVSELRKAIQTRGGDVQAVIGKNS